VYHVFEYTYFSNASSALLNFSPVLTFVYHRYESILAKLMTLTYTADYRYILCAKALGEGSLGRPNSVSNIAEAVVVSSQYGTDQQATMREMHMLQSRPLPKINSHY
jgi:hypothetical protein